MARPKRATQTANSVGRTIERVAIAALAAIVAHGSSESVALTALAIFIIVVVVEELGRRWFWRGKRVTLRDVALSSVGELRLQRARARRRYTRRKRRPGARRGGGAAADGEGHKAHGSIQE